MSNNGNIFDSRFNALSIKQQYFTLKFLMLDRERAGEIMNSGGFIAWIHDNQNEVADKAPEWNIQFNSFKP